MSNPAVNRARGTTLVRSVIAHENMNNTHLRLLVVCTLRPPHRCLPTARAGCTFGFFDAHCRRTCRHANAVILEAGRGEVAGLFTGSGRMADG
jgi:hypothetical protein